MTALATINLDSLAQITLDNLAALVIDAVIVSGPFRFRVTGTQYNTTGRYYITGEQAVQEDAS